MLNKIAILSILIMPSLVRAQNKNLTYSYYEGVVEEYLPGLGFVYERVKIATNEGVKQIWFYPQYGEQLLADFKPGTSVKVKTRKRKTPDNEVSESFRRYFYRENLVEISNSSTTLANEFQKKTGKRSSDRSLKVILEKKAGKILRVDGEVMGATLPGQMVAYEWYPFFHRDSYLDKVEPGDKISFYGFQHAPSSGEVSAKPGFSVVNFNPLHKAEGYIKSFLHKQNYLYMGLVIVTDNEELRLSFPSELAVPLKKISGQGKRVTFYYEKGESINMQPPGLYAVAYEGDTIKAERSFFGDTGGKYKDEEFSYTGTIKQIERSDKGIINAIIVDNKILLEPTSAINTQLIDLLAKGMEITITGRERIKKEGEIYEKNYVIVRPVTLKIENREYIIGY